ncbi:MAG: type II toxin-antitoxin system VapC family toxin [Caldilineaceae bacterium]|nr:type II toxin-antitoxin system VapC family toxin [Caldilineaceae bacterium]MBP8107202.1 type II toxin-antitoxin system VapC family toxin [Caldilineaceae bacterium]MBP8122237.1 type II toxin-antitoxin system VapC family toxin [Caldilineaceae bacterium]MBP9072808.1 type II toxin-antitoxin system VapC family toxin [Caldilineaceae bacterium]
MNILLDTHIFLWYISDEDRIPAPMLASIRNPDNAVYLSVVSLWEIIIKYQLGKIPLAGSPEVYIPVERQRHLIASLSVDEASVKQLIKLPSLHRDPFDRLLICQAREHGMALATVDGIIKAYPVETL